MKVLVAEDEPVLRRFLQSHLAKCGYEVELAEDGARAWEILQQKDAPRLALLDWMMPGKDGVEICREARQRIAQPYTYIVLLTSKNDPLDRVEGFESGADDYLTKPFSPRELQLRLRVGKRIVELEDRLLAAQDALHHKATHDLLTDLWNRAAILEALARELARARREASPVGVLLADIDHFKSINDMHGHLAGDAVLREVARRMANCVRPYDAIGRYGGEEFLIVLPGCDATAVRDKGEQFRKAIEAQAVKTAEGAIRVTLSFGAASSGEKKIPAADTVLRAADTALYRAKSAGRNRVELARDQDFAAVESEPALHLLWPTESRSG